MSFLGLFGKKKKSELQLPPPPRIDSQEFVSDIPEIRLDEIPEPPKQKSAKALPPEISDESLPEFPSFPSVEPVEGEPSENVPFHKAEFVVEEESLPKKDDSVVFDRTIQVASQKPVEVMHKKLTSYKTFVSLNCSNSFSTFSNVSFCSGYIMFGSISFS